MSVLGLSCQGGEGWKTQLPKCGKEKIPSSMSVLYSGGLYLLIIFGRQIFGGTSMMCSSPWVNCCL